LERQRHNEKTIIAVEGAPFILIAAFLSLIAYFTGFTIVAVILGIIAIFIIALIHEFSPVFYLPAPPLLHLKVKTLQ